MTDTVGAAPPAPGSAQEPWLSCWSDAALRRWTLTGDVVTVGRAATADVPLDDPLVSRLHARFERIGGRWSVVDDGLSRNGTWVDGQRVSGRRVLHDRDSIRLGRTVLVFCAPGEHDEPHTLVGEPLPLADALTPAQRAVVAALCRPVVAGGAAPATNTQIAAELHLSVDAVKTHLRGVAHRWGIDHLPQNEKRARTAQLAVQLGLVVPERAVPTAR
jgi:pSer/pThr/pTyr-binding forkhead associated (FHA) protein